MRVSYCCMKNIGSLIKEHNAKILNTNKIDEKPCNCKKRNCPLQDTGVSCRIRNVIYKAEIETQNSKKYYIGLCETEFKQRYANHVSSIKRGTKATLLSSYINELKSKSIDYKIKWSIIGRTRGLRNGDESCRLCVKEATAITFADNSCINKKKRNC